MPRAPELTLFVALVFGTAACGDEHQVCRGPGETFPTTPVSVAQARDSEGSELTTVEGALFVGEAGGMRICRALTTSCPPRCRRPFLGIEGLRDLAAFGEVEKAAGVRWAGSVRIGGAIEDGVLRIVLACRTQEVVDHFRERTGETLTLNTFISNESVEAVDFASLPSLVPPRLRKRYGFFSVRVALDGRGTLEGGLGDTNRGERGIRWRREDGDWLAFKKYEHDVWVIWVAGKERRTDERWERLDAVLSGFT